MLTHYLSPDPSDSSALDEFLAKDATIVVNGVQISRAELENLRLQGKKFKQTATVSFVGVPADKDKPFDVSSDSDY